MKVSILFQVTLKPEKVGLLPKVVFSRVIESDTAVDFPYEKIVAGAYLLFNPKFHIFNFSINQVL